MSSFEAFSKHPDEVRRDGSEGLSISNVSDGEKEAFLVTQVGNGSYVLCASTVNNRSLADRFKYCDAAIEIIDSTQFANNVSTHLPQFRGGHEGHCMYREDGVIRRKLSAGSISDTLERNRLPDGNLDMNMLAEIAGRAGGTEQYYFKNFNYVADAEYRLFWNCDIEAEHIDIKCPEARQFCQPVYFDQ